MAIADEWDRVVTRVKELGGPSSRWASTVAATLELIDKLRADPRFQDIHPNLSIATVWLRYVDVPRFVMVAYTPEDKDQFELWFVDPPLEFSNFREVTRGEVVDALVEYLDRAKASVAG